MRSLKFLNQKGFTLPEVMIAAALLGGVALVTAKLMSDQASNQAYIKNVAELNAIVTKIEGHINNPVHCRDFFQGRFAGSDPAPGAPKAMGSPGTIDNILRIFTNVPAPINALSEGPVPNTSYTIPDNGVGLQVSYYGDSIADLVITFEHNAPGFLSRHRSTVVKRIPFVVQFDSGMRIKDCGPVLGEANSMGKKKLCDSLGPGTATWDESTRTCMINQQQCPHGQVVTKMTSLGGIICEDLAGQVNLNEIFETTPKSCIGKPNLSIIKNAAGKFEVNCN